MKIKQRTGTALGVMAILWTAGSLAWAAPLISTNAVWRWQKGLSEASDPPTQWRNPRYDDSSWPSAPAPFYYGESLPSGTELTDMRYSYTSIFLRRQFEVGDASQVTGLTLRTLLEDGAIVWINGYEVYRFNMGEGEIPHDGTALPPAREMQWYDFELEGAADLLLTGLNVIAVQVFNVTVTSSDLVFDGELNAQVADSELPEVAAVDPAPGQVAGLGSLTVTFTEPVTGIVAEDLLINEVPAQGMTGGGAVYSFSFAQPASGTIAVRWDGEHEITDTEGNRFDETAPGAMWEYLLVDNLPPVMVNVLPVPEATVGRLTQIEVLFNEAVTGLDASDLLMNGVPVSAVSGAGAGPYVFEFSQPAEGTVHVGWAAGHGIRDGATPPNDFAGGQWTYELNPSLADGEVVINEFLAVNSTGLSDEDGDYADWIELRNRGSETVNLAGWSLTDDANDRERWVFPAVTLPSGGYLVVFASGKDRRPAGGAPLHTNFKLSGLGEFLGLFNAEVPRQAVMTLEPEYPEQRGDISYGIGSEGQLSYFETPTPGAVNSAGQVYEGVVDPPAASVAGGFFEEAFELHLSTAVPGATIRYTLDGSEPSPSNGTIYTGPLTILGTSSKAVVHVRAAGFKAGLLPSRVTTHSYIFPEHVLTQPAAPEGFPTAWVTRTGASRPADYEMDPHVVNDPNYSAMAREGMTSLPALSIVMDVDDLFGSQSGIYANPGESGVAWERPVSMELLFPDGQPGIQVDAGFRLQGGTSRELNKSHKNSLRLLFKGDYGPAKLEFPVFPDSPVRRFDTLILDSWLNYVWHYRGGSSPAEQRRRAQYVRDQYVADLQIAAGSSSPYGRYVHLYLNGLYWGIVGLHDRPDASFAAEHLGGEKEEYDSLKNTTGFEALDGDFNAWNQMMGLANSGLANNAQYEAIQQYLDVTNLIDNMIVNIWVGNTDWPHHNWYAARRRTPGGRFRFFIWDAEHVMKGAGDNRTGVSNANTPAQLYDQLRRNNEEFRLAFADRLHRHFFNGGVFYTDPAAPGWDPEHPERNRPAALYMRRIAEIDPAIVLESARWGDNAGNSDRPGEPYERNVEWLTELNRLIDDYFPQRSAIVLNQFRTIGLYPSLAAPVFDRHGGAVPAGYPLVMSAPSGSIYYTTDGSDPRVYGTGAVSASAVLYEGPVVLSGSVKVKARARSGNQWSALNEATFTVGQLGLPLRITEIMYNPPGGDQYEFIEFQNLGGAAIDLSGFSFDGVSFTFQSGTMIQAGERLVLASDVSPAAFAARYLGVTVAGYFGGSLSNGGERLALLDAAGETVVSVDYDDANGWPLEADGGGYSLEIIDPWGDPDAPSNWRASGLLLGSPGMANATPPEPEVRLNELMAHNISAVDHEGTFPDWIELHNPGAAAVNLSGWSLSDSGVPGQFVFPNGTSLPAGDYLVVWCDAATNTTSGFHADFALGRNGETAGLYDAASNRVDAVTFGVQLTDRSLGRVDGKWVLNDPTPGAANVAAEMGSVDSLWINEWLADSLPGEEDWLELYNGDVSLPVSLAGLQFRLGQAIARVESLSFIEAGGFVRFWADRLPGADHLDFKLPAGGGEIVLFDAGAAEVDRVVYGLQTEGASEGRLPDGGTAVVGFFGSASPGASNHVLPVDGPRLNEILARNQRAVTNASGRVADFVELRNPTATAIDLTGMSLAEGGAGAGQWTFPQGSALAAGGYLVVWFDGGLEASTVAGPVLNAGRGLSGRGGSVRLFDASGRVLDSVEYGFQVADLSIGRSGTEWRLLGVPTPGVANSSAASLTGSGGVRINEWMAQVQGGNDWFELYNGAGLPVDLGGCYLSDDPSLVGRTRFQIPPLSFIGAGGFVVWEADGSAGKGPDHVNFSLNVAGESLLFHDPQTNLVDAVYFGRQLAGVSEGRLPDGEEAIAAFATTPTPGGSNYLPPQGAVINEVLTHTDPPLEDAVEVFNPSGLQVNLSGWYLSDDAAELKKFRIPDGTILPPGGYVVFYENALNGGAGSIVPFAFSSARGDEVHLSEADAEGELTGYRATATFGPQLNGVSFGRYQTSVGMEFVALDEQTFGVDQPSSLAEFRTGGGKLNAAGRVGPVVINEIHYHPPDLEPVDGASGEYLELHNPTLEDVPLYDPGAPTNTWRLRDGVEFDFPTGLSLEPGEFLLVVDFDPDEDIDALAAFRARHGLSESTRVVGPYSGRLDNAGERLELFRPDAPESSGPNAGWVPYVLVEAVEYGDAHPWPAGADGGGESLQRISAMAFGNEPLNWRGAPPTAGAANEPGTGMVDTDGDGLPDEWELAHGLDPESAEGDDGADGDPDGDGRTNLEEFRSGTDPRDPDSVLRFESARVEGADLVLEFNGMPGRSYSVLRLDVVGAGGWTKVEDIVMDESAGMVQVRETLEPARQRFYRIVTPSVP